MALLNEKGLVRFKEGNTLHALQAQAKVQTDLQAAQAMQKAINSACPKTLQPQ